MDKKRIILTSVIWREGDVYVSKCPELEVSSCGDTPEEALKNLKEAVELYLENAKELGMYEDVEVAFASDKFISSFEVEVSVNVPFGISFLFGTITSNLRPVFSSTL